jgi:catechol-2,3-dioxygenase
MYLEHLNLVVSDIPKTLNFYQAAFPHWKIRSSGKTNWYGVDRNWIHFGDDYHYIAFNDEGSGHNRDLKSPLLGLAHFAYVTNNLNDVVERLKNAGYAVANLGATNQYRKNSYFIDPDGYEIEFVEYLSDLPTERTLEDS